MDGNVMENPRYHQNLMRDFMRFQKVTLEEASAEVIEHMEKLFDNDIKSGARLADNVQEVADMFVLVPFLIRSNDSKASAIQLERVKKLIDKMKFRVSEFENISDGSCKLLNETVLLIDAVFANQVKEHANAKKDPSKILEIRGSIFINPSSRVLYYDYMGLYFLHRATSIVCKHQEIGSLKERIESVKGCSDEDLGMAKIYAQKASDCFRKAKENAGDDMMWDACTTFNIARAEYMIKQFNQVLGEEVNNNWEDYANESIRGWITLNKIIAEHLPKKENKTWLQQALISQENKMRLSKVIYQMIDDQPITDYNGKIWIEKEHYRDFIQTKFYDSIPKSDPQARTDSLINDIKSFII